VQKVKKIVWDFFKVTFVTIGLFLVVDLIAGDRIIVSIRQAEPFRVQHPTYHHTLKPNYDGLGRWGNWTYKMCTNLHGFKDKCNALINASKSFDVAFMGDSFTEGIGLPFEQTFVGLVAQQYPDLRIANLGVVSYSPAIYLAKLKDLYTKGYRFKHVIVFIDIGDVFDEANAYDLHNDTIVVDKGEPYPLSGLRYLRRVAAKNLPLTGEAWVQIRKLKTKLFTTPTRESLTAPTASAPAASAAIVSPKSGQPEQLVSSETAQQTQASDAPFIQNIYEGIYLKNYPKSEWTYNVQSTQYGEDGVLGTLEKMKREMAAVHVLTKDYGSTLSIGVYPWPGQILHDKEDSLQVRTWHEFCQTRCLHFYNVFPSFFKLASETSNDAVVQNHYFAGDAHFNALGNKIVADVIVKQGIQ
jgi:hypothetical protein